jgi:hypothetical protein
MGRFAVGNIEKTTDLKGVDDGHGFINLRPTFQRRLITLTGSGA